MKNSTLVTARVEVSDILPMALTLVVAGIGIAFGLDVLNDTREDFGKDACTGSWNTANQTCTVSSTNQTLLSANNDAYNATTDSMTGVAKFADKMGLIATVIVAALVIGLLVRFLFVR